jgi:HD-GYP domain-containing protein (c-di-GMP phosphodiesterase class II)
MAFLRIKSGPTAGRVLKIGEEKVTIGRDDGQTIQVLEQGVSRAHAEVFRIGDLCFLRDLESKNGSFVNGRRVTEEILQDADEIQIGATVIRFELKAGEEPLAAEGGAAGSLEHKKASDTILVLTPEKGRAEAEPAADAQMKSQERITRNISAVVQIAGIVQTEDEVDAILGKSLDFLLRVVEASQCFLLAYEPATGNVTLRSFAEAEEFAGPRKISRTVLKQVAQANRPVFSTNAAVDERFALSESVVLQKIHSVLCAPVLASGGTTLLLYAHLDSPERAFTPEDLDLCAAAAVHLGTALFAEQRHGARARRLSALLDVVVRLSEARDPRQAQHGRRVARAADALAAQLGLDRDEVETLKIAALVHDVGKLASDGKNERAHLEAARSVMEPIGELEPVLRLVLRHHERADGSGFPRGLKNDQMTVAERILIVANAFDNLLTGGGSRGGPMEASAAIQAMAARGGTEFDDEVVRALLICHRNGTLLGKSD